MAPENLDRDGPPKAFSGDASGGSRGGMSSQRPAAGGSGMSSSGGMSQGMTGGATGSSTEQAKEVARQTLDQARQQVTDLAGRATEQGKSMLAQGKDTAATQVSTVAQAIRSTAEQLQGDTQSQTIGQFVGMAADRLESFGRGLRDKDVDTLIHDAQDMARRAPVAFFAGAVVTGFLLARFLKSSADRSAADRSSRHLGGIQSGDLHGDGGLSGTSAPSVTTTGVDVGTTSYPNTPYSMGANHER